MRAAIAKFIASLGAMGGNVLNHLIQKLLAGRRVSKHQTTAANFRTKGRKRLNISRGAGSISAKADIQQLCNIGRYAEAREMAEAHERQCGEKLFRLPGGERVTFWRR